MTPVERFRGDSDLLGIASGILIDEGFEVDRVDTGDGDILLAENSYFVIAIAATPTLDELVKAEPIVEGFMRQRLDAVDLGPKAWDAYVVLLTQERPSDDGSGLRPLFSINYDTRGFRRIARAAVEPTKAGLRTSLTPFIEPVTLDDAGLEIDPFVAFERALVSRGIGADLAARSVEVFRGGGRLDDAI